MARSEDALRHVQDLLARAKLAQVSPRVLGRYREGDPKVLSALRQILLRAQGGDEKAKTTMAHLVASSKANSARVGSSSPDPLASRILLRLRALDPRTWGMVRALQRSPSPRAKAALLRIQDAGARAREAKGPSFAGVSLAPAEESRLLALVNEARWSEASLWKKAPLLSSSKKPVLPKYPLIGSHASLKLSYPPFGAGEEVLVLGAPQGTTGKLVVRNLAGSKSGSVPTQFLNPRS